MRRLFAFACSPHVTHDPNGAPDAGGSGDPCTGSATRCVGNELQTCDGSTFQDTQSCAGVCTAALGCAQCGPAAFMSFDPRKLPGDPFTLIGTLSCPAAGTSIQQRPGAVTPFSMAVDRNGVAWVEYTTAEIFHVALTDAGCSASGYVARAGGMDLFGMGFVTDTAGGDTEKLYQAGGGDSAQPDGNLTMVDPADNMLTPQPLGTLSAASDLSPELTGTNEAKLYGLYPVIASGPSYVQEIDKSSGAGTGMQYMLGSAGLGNNIRDWVDRATGTHQVILQSLPYPIDGAGVSTCAPSVVQ
jgi:hypothetical protein